MKKFLSYFFLLSFALFSFSLSSCSSIESKGSAVGVSNAAKPVSELQKFLDLKNSKRLAVIKFYADWCGTCKEYEPEFAKAKALLRSESVDFLEVNVDNKEYSALIKELKIGLIPITYFVSQDRKSVENRVGYIAAGQLTEKVKSFNLK